MSNRVSKITNFPNAIAAVVSLILVGCLHSEHIPSQKETLRGREREVVDNFHKLWWHNQNTFRENKWLGVQTLQNPMDIWITQEIIVETKPDFIVETGTLYGGSALVWATILHQVNPNGRLITVDIEDHAQEAKELPLWKEKVDFFLGSSVTPEVVGAVRKRVEGKKVMIIFDSNHHKDHVFKELVAYSPFVQVGGYMIVQDTNLNGHPVYRQSSGPGPMEAVEEFLAVNKNFESDQGRGRLLFTFCPRGFLKRVK
jgi:cephalosporin hydroxylase